jgi:hypothetical protein
MKKRSANRAMRLSARWVRRLRKALICAAAATLALGGTALAQQDASDSSDKGFTSYMQFGGSASAGQSVLKLDTNAGYNFSEHVGVNFGVPFYFVGGSSTSTTGAKTSYSSAGVGAPHAAVQLTFKNSSVNYSSALTVFLPAGDTKDGLSTGQTSFDWNNRFDHSFHRVTPFAEAGLGNTVADSRQFDRPYSSHGYNAHLLAGLGVNLTDRITLGASAYDIAPWGTQTIYSRTVAHQATASAAAGSKTPNNRFFAVNGVTSGTADIARDDGFSTWVSFSPTPVVNIEVGYTRSVQFALDMASFSLRVNLAKLARKASRN